MRGSLILAMALLPLVACSFDEATPGVRGQCGATNGEPLCPADDLETGEDACWKLVARRDDGELGIPAGAAVS